MSVRLFLSSCLLGLCTLGTMVPAADTATMRTQADTLLAAGMTAMKESSTTPSRAIDAILLFDQVLVLDKSLGDIDQECDVQANIFWCKKHLNLDEVKALLAAKGDTTRATAVLTRLNDTQEAAVPASDAEAYFTRAQAYAKDHPDRPLQIAVRYFEVAERFQGTPSSLNAQRLSLEAQQQAMALESHQTDTLFSAHAAPVAAGTRQPVPTAEAIKAADKVIKDTFKDDFAKTRHAARLALVGKLATQASTTTDDAAMRYALLVQARDLAILIGDAPDVLSITDQLCAGFAEGEAPAAKKQALARIHTLPAAAMMIRLLANPDDAEANTAVGRYYGLDLQEWPTALPLLARGGDAPLKKLAEMELAAPTVAERQAEIGDGWYAESKKASDTVKDALYARALHWYEQAEGSLTGMGKTTTSKHIAEIRALILKEGITDWSNLSPAQWERVRAPVVEVAMSKPRTEVPAALTADAPVRLLPNPTDTWHVLVGGKDDPVSYKGDAQNQVGGFQAGELLMALGAGMPERFSDLSQAGPVALMAATAVTVGPGANGRQGGGGRRGGGGGALNAAMPGQGVVRVKFMAIDSH
jgi:hypothetical protein